MNIKNKNKINILSILLAVFFGKSVNLARIKFFGLFIRPLCKVQTVSFERTAVGFDFDAKVDSSLRRIQLFIAECAPETILIARFVFPYFRTTTIQVGYGKDKLEVRSHRYQLKTAGMYSKVQYVFMEKWIIWHVIGALSHKVFVWIDRKLIYLYVSLIFFCWY